MSAIGLRIRKKVIQLASVAEAHDRFDEEALLQRVVSIIDDEIEAEALKRFTQPINPDPITDMAGALE